MLCTNTSIPLVLVPESCDFAQDGDKHNGFNVVAISNTFLAQGNILVLHDTIRQSLFMFQICSRGQGGPGSSPLSALRVRPTKLSRAPHGTTENQGNHHQTDQKI